jgi:hypothetical protein
MHYMRRGKIIRKEAKKHFGGNLSKIQMICLMKENGNLKKNFSL